MQTPLQNDLARAARGTDGEGRLGRRGLRIHRQRILERKSRLQGCRGGRTDSFVGGWLLNRAAERTRKLLKPGRDQTDTSEGPG